MAGAIKCPEVGDFFDVYPITRHDMERFASETGYRYGTVMHWVRGQVRPNRRAFDCLVAAYVTPRYEVDENLHKRARDACSLREVRRNNRDETVPPLPGDVPDVELDATFYLLRLTLRSTPLSTAQRLTLIRELCGSEQ